MNQQDKPRAIIVGAGIGGLAAAIRLSVKGYQVTVFESGAAPGGKLAELQGAGFRFDAGPSLFTMPLYVDELFTLAGKDPRAYFRYQKLEEICRYFYEDGLRLTAWSDTEKLISEFSTKTAATPEEVSRFLEKSKEIYDITHRVFLERSLHKVSSYLHTDTFRSMARFGAIDAFRSQNEANESFFSDRRLVQLFNRYATYNGSNPYQAPATLNVIPHFENHFGAYLPEGGMYSIVRALERLAGELGTTFYYNEPVNEILIVNKKAVGVVTAGGTHAAAVVVSNLDVWFTYRKLLRGIPAPEKLLAQQRSSSALIFYWGINRRFETTGLHNIFFSADYRAEFDSIWKAQQVSADPTIYLNITSKMLPEDAPAGCENWFVMINVPAANGQDWQAIVRTARASMISKLSRLLGTELEPHIVYERVLDPLTIESRTGSFQGSLYGNSSNSRFSAFLRHPNFSRKIRNLYFCGGSVHPGGGIPLALLSAKIAADCVQPH
ncbi:phytoene desaturase [Pedobacter yulinensis]|uniref:Phytoene desaturase n=1 Tax=Pedobacter yulinensis TaxID=2126353 RepID=A0A2T3HQ88_9SPHI|nr:1-hydroxycarotenoid 3,4-desaturase CrtD [Pedobacter yulinensis]PST84624.1 phytoene desaturase [Pedobacter yulinensis]